MIREDECIDDLQLNGLHIIQKKTGFRFGVDAVILADFAKDFLSERTIDICTGNGIVPLLLSAKTKTKEICGLEIQADIYDMAVRSAEMNQLSQRISFMCGDLKDAELLYEKHSFYAVTCNPPYIETGKGIRSENDKKNISRQEVMCTLDDVVKAASCLLLDKGRFFMVHRPSRLADIICIMRKYKVEPKRLRFVSPLPGKAPNLILVEGIQNGGHELKIMPELYIYKDAGNYSDEINRIYGR